MRKVLFGIIGLLSFSSPAVAQDFSETTILPAGSYAWNNAPVAPGPLHIKVNLTTQMAYVYRGDQMIAITNVSSGRPGFDTPTGVFHIKDKEKNHFSHTYKANMPFTQWLTDTGVALHSGSVNGQPSSHGCIHLPLNFAQRLFTMTQVGDEVDVVGNNFDEAFAPYMQKVG